MTDRDHFAAAALTGLLASDQYDRLVTAADYAETAFELADAMLCERCRAGGDCPGQDNAPNHDAAPAARASLPTADHAVCRGRESGCGTGDTDHGAAPAARASVGRPRTDKADLPTRAGTGDTPDSPKPIKGGVSDRSKPINGPDPDSRVWETPVHTPAPHATPGEGSERRECAEPVAWATFHGTAHCVAEPLYRRPQPTLTDAEREALHWFSHYGLPEPKAAALRGLLERLGGAK